MHVRTHFKPWKLRKRLVAQAWSGDQDQAQVVDLALHQEESPGDFVQEMASDRGATYSGNGNLLVLPVPQAGARGSRISKSGWVERLGIATIAKVLISPLANDGKTWTKGFLHDIVSVAVGAQKGLALISLDWQAPDKVGQKDKGLPLQFRVFMIVIVHIPGLVSDDEIVVLRLHKIGKGHEVVHHDLIHGAQREEGGEVMLAGDMLKVTTFISKVAGNGMNVLAFALQIGRSRVNGKPINGEIRFKFAQFARNGKVALDVSQANGAGEQERFARAAHRPGPRACFLWRTDEASDCTVEQRGIARRRHMSPTLNSQQLCVRDTLVDGKSPVIRGSAVTGAMDHECWCSDASSMLSHIVAKPSLARHIDNLACRRPAIAHPILIWPGGVRLGEEIGEKSIKIAGPVAAHLFTRGGNGSSPRGGREERFRVSSHNDEMRDELRLFRSQANRRHSRGGNANNSHALEREMVQNGQQVSVVLVKAIGSGLHWSIRASIPPQIHRHHLKVSREIRHSGFEGLHVDNLVEWSKDNRRTTLAPHGEIRAHTFALDEAVSGRYDSFVGRGTIR